MCLIGRRAFEAALWGECFEHATWCHTGLWSTLSLHLGVSFDQGYEIRVPINKSTKWSITWYCAIMTNNCGECRYSLIPVRTFNAPICGCKLGVGQIMSTSGIHMVPVSHSCKLWVGDGSRKARRTGTGSIGTSLWMWAICLLNTRSGHPGTSFWPPKPV